MIRFLLLFIDHTTSTYLMLFYFSSTFAFAYNVETNYNNDSILPISNNELIIKGNTTFYISEETVISNFEVIHLAEPDTIVKDTITVIKEKNKKESFKNIKNLKNLKKNKNQHSEILTLKNKIFSYLPYESSAFFINYISSSLGIFPITDYSIFFIHSDHINKYIEFSVKYEILNYNYIFCDYSICLSQLEIRSP